MNQRRGRCARSTHLLALLSLLPTGLAAQAGGTVAGVVGGYTTTEVLFRPDAETDEVGGLLIGAFVDAQTPVEWLSIRAEGAYTQRGGDVLADAQGLPLNGGMRTDYVSVTVQARAALALGSVRLHVAVGPTIDQLIRSRLDASLEQLLDREHPTVFGVGAGIGIGGWVTARVFAEIEARIVEGLGDAFSGDFISVRHRSTAIVARVGVPIRR